MIENNFNSDAEEIMKRVRDSHLGKHSVSYSDHTEMLKGGKDNVHRNLRSDAGDLLWSTCTDYHNSVDYLSGGKCNFFGRR